MQSMQLAITLNEEDLALAVTKHIKDELGIESEVTITLAGNNTYIIEATAGEAKPAPKRTRRTKEQIQQEEQTTSPTQLSEPEVLVPMAPLEPEVFVPTPVTQLFNDEPIEEPANLFEVSKKSVFSID